MLKPIEELTDLERRIIHHHIVTFPHFTNGLSINGLFPSIHQDEVDAAILKLIEYGYYNKVKHHSVTWTSDGYHRCQNFFKNAISNRVNSDTSVPGIPYPNKITIKWLRDHAPHYFWGWLCSLIIASFCAGIFFGKTVLYQRLITPANKKTQETTKEVKDVSKIAAPSTNDTRKK